MKERKEMFYLMMHSIHFICCYMVLDRKCAPATSWATLSEQQEIFPQRIAQCVYLLISLKSFCKLIFLDTVKVYTKENKNLKINKIKK